MFIALSSPPPQVYIFILTTGEKKQRYVYLNKFIFNHVQRVYSFDLNKREVLETQHLWPFHTKISSQIKKSACKYLEEGKFFL